MRIVIVALQVLVPLALVLGVFALTMRDQLQLARRANRDDWRGVRDAASSRYDQVGARLDVAGVGVLRARVDRNATLRDAAEAELRALGALGHLREVDEARREIDGLG